MRRASIFFKTSIMRFFTKKQQRPSLHINAGDVLAVWHYVALCHPVSFILTRFPDPLAFGSGSGLQCVYTVVISLWGTPAAKFVLESPKMVFYWIAPCIRKPQAEFHKFATTHVSPSSHWKPSTQSPLSPSTHLPLLNVYFSPFAYICISHRSFCLISTISQKSSVTHS